MITPATMSGLGAAMLVLVLGAPAKAVQYDCELFKDGASVHQSKLDTAGTTFFEFRFEDEQPVLVGFCYTAEGDGKVLLGCGFAAEQAEVAAFSERRMQERAGPEALQEGFFSVGDTVASPPEDVLVGFTEQAGTSPEFAGYCVQPEQ
jgi:hypothetical protein